MVLLTALAIYGDTGDENHGVNIQGVTAEIHAPAEGCRSIGTRIGTFPYQLPIQKNLVVQPIVSRPDVKRFPDHVRGDDCVLAAAVVDLDVTR